MVGRRDIKAARLLTVAFILILGLSLSAASAQSLLHVTFLDVGQGDCALIRTPGGQAVLVDAGDPGAEGTILGYLRLKGIQRLDLVVATHPDDDHIGGLVGVLREYDVAELYDSGKTHTTRCYAGCVEITRVRGIPVTHVRAGALKSEDGTLFAFLWPADPLPGNNNDCSVVFRMEYGRKASSSPETFPTPSRGGCWSLAGQARSPTS